MVYLNNIPTPTDNPSTQSQAQFLENFTQLDTQFGTDHIAFSAGSGNGYHQLVTLNDVQADPGQAFPITSIYTKHVGAGPNRYTNLYYEADPENAVAASQFPLNSIKAWASFDYTAASPVVPADGFNVTNVTKNSNFQFTINFTNALQNANYAIFCLASASTTFNLSSRATTNCVIMCTNSLSLATFVSFVVIGT